MEYPKDLKNRLKRIEGQIRGVLRMMEDEQECSDVVNQLSAIRNAVDRVSVRIVGLDMGKCLLDDLEKEEELRDADKIINDAIQLLMKTR